MKEIKELVKNVISATERLKLHMEVDLAEQDVPVDLQEILDKMHYIRGYITCMDNNGITGGVA